jgi:hypothetical protein
MVSTQSDRETRVSIPSDRLSTTSQAGWRSETCHRCPFKNIPVLCGCRPSSMSHGRSIASFVGPPILEETRSGIVRDDDTRIQFPLVRVKPLGAGGIVAESIRHPGEQGAGSTRFSRGCAMLALARALRSRAIPGRAAETNRISKALVLTQRRRDAESGKSFASLHLYVRPQKLMFGEFSVTSREKQRNFKTRDSGGRQDQGHGARSACEGANRSPFPRFGGLLSRFDGLNPGANPGL